MVRHFRDYQIVFDHILAGHFVLLNVVLTVVNKVALRVVQKIPKRRKSAQTSYEKAALVPT